MPVSNAGLFAFSLHIPLASTLCLAGLAVGALPRLLSVRAISRRFLIAWAVLAIALVDYYIVCARFGFQTLPTGLGYATVAFLAYGTGYSIAATGPKRDGIAAVSSILIAVTGATLFAAGSAFRASSSELEARMAPSLWDGGLMKAPGVGALGLLGMALVALLAFGDPASHKTRWPMRLWLFATVAAGAWANFALQNRTPFVAVFGILAATGIVYWRASSGRPHRARRVLLITTATLFMVVLVWNIVVQTNIFQRFATEGLETARYDLWYTVVTGLPSHPHGGREIRLAEPHVHNLWLDVAWDAGITPFLLLLAFHLLHVRPALEFLRQSRSLNLRLAVVAIGVALLFSMMAEPALALPIVYFSFSCYFLGSLLGLRDRLTRRSFASVLP